MGILEDIADQLAVETIGIIEKTGDDSIIRRVADALGGSSQTMEEAYLTACRVRRAEVRARAMLAQYKAQARRPADE
ncbi:hypothetical protein AB1M95_10955 [Sulfitobacter sp. LCG007]